MADITIKILMENNNGHAFAAVDLQRIHLLAIHGLYCKYLIIV